MVDNSSEYRLLGCCKWCGEEIFGMHRNKKVAHQQWCQKNPNRSKRLKGAQLGGRRGGKAIKDMWHEKKQSPEWIAYHNEKHVHILKCKNCSTDFKICITDYDFEKHNYSDFCTDFCAHSYSGKCADPDNISNGVKTSEKAKIARSKLCKPRKLYSCKQCGKQFYANESLSLHKVKSFCSEICYEKYLSLHPKKYHPGGKRENTGHGKKGWYKGYYCDSSWELAWVIYQLDHGIKFERYKNWFLYEYNGKQLKYYPDFLMADGSFVEIKGWKSEQWQAKLKFFPKDKILRILYKAEMKPIFQYVESKYGKNWIELYDKK